MPSGLARSSAPPPELKPAAAAYIAAVFANSLLDIADIPPPLAIRNELLGLEFPTFSTFRADVLIQCIRVNHFHVRTIPIQFQCGTRGNIPKKQSLRHQPREFK